MILLGVVWRFLHVFGGGFKMILLKRKWKGMFGVGEVGSLQTLLGTSNLPDLPLANVMFPEPPEIGALASLLSDPSAEDPLLPALAC